MDERDQYDITDAEEIQVIRTRPAGAVISVRFNPDELRRLRDGMNRLGERRPSRFLKAAAFRELEVQLADLRARGGSAAIASPAETTVSVVSQPVPREARLYGGAELTASKTAPSPRQQGSHS